MKTGSEMARMQNGEKKRKRLASCVVALLNRIACRSFATGCFVLCAGLAWGGSGKVSPLDFDGTDSDRIAAAVEKAQRTGCCCVSIPRKPDGTAWMIDRAILLPNDFTLEVDDCIVQLASGVRDNLIRNAGAVEGRITGNRNIVVRGRGHAVLCGGTENHYAPNRSGDVNGWRTISILFCKVDGFKIENLTLRETQAWGVSVEHGCVHGRIADINFEDTNKMLNQDGVDVRKGCHDILIENITGVCGDDIVALTALRRSTPMPPGISMQIGGVVPTEDDDVYDITIRNICARCAGGHGIIRLLCQDGVKMHDVVVSNIVDTTDLEKGDKRASAAVRIGDVNYWSICKAKLGDMHGIVVDGVNSKAKTAVLVSGMLSDSMIRNVTGPADAQEVTLAAETSNVVVERKHVCGGTDSVAGNANK